MEPRPQGPAPLAGSGTEWAPANPKPNASQVVAQSGLAAVYLTLTLTLTPTLTLSGSGTERARSCPSSPLAIVASLGTPTPNPNLGAGTPPRLWS